MRDSDSDLSPETLAKVLRSRRTINEFLPRPVSPELIRTAIDLARWAPNHKLTEPWRFHLIGPQTAAAIVDLNARLVLDRQGPVAAEQKRAKWSQIPGWLAITCAKHPDPLREREDYAACCCAVENFSLFLWSHGIGVKWTTGEVTRDPTFLRLLEIAPDERSVVGLFWYGYPARVPDSRRGELDDVLRALP